ncbi:MAG: aldolase/citrate lyase family protein [Rhodospirillales bacterium]
MSESLKQRLQAGETLFGFWHMTCSPMVAEVLGQSGYDCTMIDLEHGPGSYLDAQTSMQALSATGCAPLVRVPFNSRVEVKRALDIGAEGIMCPAVNTVAEAEEAARACRYPPAGVRGMAPTVVRASDYGRDWQAYMERSDRDVLCICQIETGEAVENVAEIAAVAGVDLLFVGPMDLSADLGHPGQPDHPDVDAAMRKVEAAAKAHAVALGAIPTPGRSSRDLQDLGYRFILPDGDVPLLRAAAEASLAKLRGAT